MVKVVKMEELPKSARPVGRPFMADEWCRHSFSEHKALEQYALGEATKLGADYVVLGESIGFPDDSGTTYKQAAQAYKDAKRKK